MIILFEKFFSRKIVKLSILGLVILVGFGFSVIDAKAIFCGNNGTLLYCAEDPPSACSATVCGTAGTYNFYSACYYSSGHIMPIKSEDIPCEAPACPPACTASCTNWSALSSCSATACGTAGTSTKSRVCTATDCSTSTESTSVACSAPACPTCTPNNCATTTCSNTTCWNGCATVTGTKYCPSACTPNNCATITCSNTTCWNGCATVTGTKNCTSTCTPNNCATTTCSGTTCWNGCATVWGTKYCPPACVPNCNCAANTNVGSSCLNNCGTAYCPGTKCVPSCGDTNNYCSGVKYNDGCSPTNTCTGTKDPGCASASSYCPTSGYDNGCYWCTGTKNCGIDYCGTSPGGYYCTGNTLNWFYDYCTKQCNGTNCSCSWAYNACNPSSVLCGSRVCDSTDPDVEFCQGGDIWTKDRGIVDFCSAPSCQTKYEECNHTLKEPCPVGYTCRASGDTADCVAKSATWTEE